MTLLILITIVGITLLLWSLQEKRYINNENWKMVYFFVVGSILEETSKLTVNPEVEKIQKAHGVIGLVELAKTLTDEFRYLHKDKIRELSNKDLLTEIEKFMKEKLSSP